MGKGFQNFMSKKDFHPSAWWNLKKVWEAKELKNQKEKKEAEMRVQYAKEQEMLNNKALLGDEKAKMGLSFMYDAPAGMMKREEPKEEPKFEWQRKFQAPREEWAKNNELIQDQPFGIQVRNVRCCKCHKWGHLNTDNECPLYGMSGNYDDPGYANNPSDLIRQYRKEKVKEGPSNVKRDRMDDEEWVDKAQLAEEMQETHGMKLKGNLLSGIHQEQQLAAIKTEPVGDIEEMKEFLSSLSEKEKKKLMKKLMAEQNGVKDEKMSKKEKKALKRLKKKSKKEKKIAKREKELKKKIKKEVRSSSESSSSDNDSDSSASPKRNRRHDSSSPPRRHQDRAQSSRKSAKSDTQKSFSNDLHIKQEPMSPGTSPQPDNSPPRRRRHDSDESDRKESRRNVHRSKSPRRRSHSRDRHDSSSRHRRDRSRDRSDRRSRDDHRRERRHRSRS